MNTSARPIKQKKKWNILVLVLAVVLAALLAAMAFAGNYLFTYALDPTAQGTMLNPADSGQPQEPSAEQQWFDASCEDRWLTSYDGLTLHGCYIPQVQDSHLYAVVCHGYGSEPRGMADYAARFYDMGFSILAPAARGHEQSQGDYVGMGWHERHDIVDWINTLVEQDPEAQILLFGVSMGGATVMMVSGEELPGNVKCIIEDCGYTSVWDEFKLQLKEVFGLPSFPLLNAASLVCQIRAGYSFEEASSVEQLKKATLPMLFIHGEEDDFVPYSMLQPVYDACASQEKELLSVPGAGHAESASTDPELYWGTITAFLEKHFVF